MKQTNIIFDIKQNPFYIDRTVLKQIEEEQQQLDEQDSFLSAISENESHKNTYIQGDNNDIINEKISESLQQQQIEITKQDQYLRNLLQSNGIVLQNNNQVQEIFYSLKSLDSKIPYDILPLNIIPDKNQFCEYILRNQQFDKQNNIQEANQTIKNFSNNELYIFKKKLLKKNTKKSIKNITNNDSVFLYEFSRTYENIWYTYNKFQLQNINSNNSLQQLEFYQFQQFRSIQPHFFQNNNIITHHPIVLITFCQNQDNLPLYYQNLSKNNQQFNLIDNLNLQNQEEPQEQKFIENYQQLIQNNIDLQLKQKKNKKNCLNKDDNEEFEKITKKVKTSSNPQTPMEKFLQQFLIDSLNVQYHDQKEDITYLFQLYICKIDFGYKHYPTYTLSEQKISLLQDKLLGFQAKLEQGNIKKNSKVYKEYNYLNDYYKENIQHENLLSSQ